VNPALNHLFAWADLVAFRLGGESVLWSDLIGNLAGLATVALALRRSLWTWPVQIAGSVLLFGASLSVHLGGNAARQVVIILAASYGWWRWNKQRGAEHPEGVAVRWATGRERIALVLALAAGTLLFAWLLTVTKASWAPLPDAYIFIGTLAATLAQAKGWVEFWFVWVAVDLVGVPLAFHSGLPVSGFTYGIYFALVLAGMRQWIGLARARRADSGAVGAVPAPAPAAPAATTAPAVPAPASIPVPAPGTAAGSATTTSTTSGAAAASARQGSLA
jgi:nicotinamide mononucleotide transporter